MLVGYSGSVDIVRLHTKVLGDAKHAEDLQQVHNIQERQQLCVVPSAIAGNFILRPQILTTMHKDIFIIT